MLPITVYLAKQKHSGTGTLLLFQNKDIFVVH